ncbi:MAG: hypothetical protein DI629_11995 [Mesorhizobium amorphae]|nr:MAG: hypothetical protein DI629_11995 [Mesorhizobium amorphae]
MGRTIDAYAALLDFIAVPQMQDVAYARRMVLRMTSRIPDAQTAGDMVEDLNALLDAVVRASTSAPDFMAFYEAQENAREMLERCKRLGTQ